MPKKWHPSKTISLVYCGKGAFRFQLKQTEG